MNVHISPNPLMPPEAPVEMPTQSLSARPIAADTRRDDVGTWIARGFVFSFALAIPAALGWVLHDWFRAEGIIWAEAGIIGFALFAAFWIALSVATAVLGCLPRKTAQALHGAPLDIAVVQPIYGEPIGPVLARARALLLDLARHPTGHRYCYYVLSDTRDPGQVETERRAVALMMAGFPGGVIHYRNRAQNHRFKVGNIEDWVTRWGGHHDAMLVLDADSVMTAKSVTSLADTMAAEPRLGLVQSIPRLIGARSIFARAQAFANTAYGTTLARGLSRWAGNTANYWGHNALIRLTAFAAAAGLPDLPGRRPFGGVVLSHDFVEAALLRRAGWQIRFLTDATESYETTPETVIGHILRDRRWCQGNLQHLRILFARGFHPLSRMHMLQGAVAYLASTGWFALMVLWVLVGSGQGDGAIQYFSAANPMFPAWPQMELVSRILIVSLTYGMLLAPKLLGAIAFCIQMPRLSQFGGWGRFWGSFLLELVVSIMLAPMMMVQHMVAVFRTLCGFDTGWTRAATSHKPLLYLRFHALELVLGVAMTTLFILGALTWWLLPIAVLLTIAPALSWAVSAAPAWAMHLLTTPHDQSAAPERADTLAQA
ncbi:MAG: glucans biosynthesis glucosyltransferase MdoH [Pseudomonadota bacterium]